MEIVRPQYVLALDDPESISYPGYLLGIFRKKLHRMIDVREIRFMEKLAEKKMNSRDVISMSGGYYI